MKSPPTTSAPIFLCFIFFALPIFISWTKDNEMFQDTVLDDSSTSIEETVDETTEEAEEQEDTTEETVSLEEGRRTSYLMFDLSQIDSIGGTPNNTNLEFTIDSDDGSGTMSVFKGESNNWSEEETADEETTDEDTTEVETDDEAQDGETTEEESTEKENKAPVAVAKASTSSGEAPLEVQFNARDSNDDDEIESYRWDFKDGNTTDEPGTYEVELSVTDEDGLEDSNTVTITVEEADNEAPKAVASANPTSGEANLKVQFKGSGYNEDKKVNVSIDYNHL